MLAHVLMCVVLLNALSTGGLFGTLHCDQKNSIWRSYTWKKVNERNRYKREMMKQGTNISIPFNSDSIIEISRVLVRLWKRARLSFHRVHRLRSINRNRTTRMKPIWKWLRCFLFISVGAVVKVLKERHSVCVSLILCILPTNGQ